MKKAMIGLVAVALLVGAVIFVGGNTGAQENTNDVVVVGMSGGYKPYTFSDENGNLTGFEVDTWNEIGKRIGKDIEFQTAEFSGLFGFLDTGKIDTISNQITVNEKRLEKYDFSDPYVHYGAQLVVRDTDTEITDLESLKGKKVGVSLGSNYEEMIKAFDKDGEIEVITYESYQASLQDVSLGRIDAVLNDKLAGMIAIEESGLDLKLGGEPVEMMFNAFPFKKSEENAVLIIEINQAIADMYEDGTFEEISLKWFPVDITKK